MHYTTEKEKNVLTNIYIYRSKHYTLTPSSENDAVTSCDWVQIAIKCTLLLVMVPVQCT